MSRIQILALTLFLIPSLASCSNWNSTPTSHQNSASDVGAEKMGGVCSELESAISEITVSAGKSMNSNLILPLEKLVEIIRRLSPVSDHERKIATSLADNSENVILALRSSALLESNWNLEFKSMQEVFSYCTS